MSPVHSVTDVSGPQRNACPGTLTPGRSPETKFGANAFPHLRGLDNPDYAPMIERIVSSMRATNGPVTHPSDVSEGIWQVATDPSSPFRVAAGADAVAWMAEAQLHTN